MSKIEIPGQVPANCCPLITKPALTSQGVAILYVTCLRHSCVCFREGLSVDDKPAGGTCGAFPETVVIPK
jgi:hypothetical protein